MKKLLNYYYIRQLKNITEQISAVEQDRNVSMKTLAKYIPKQNSTPVLFKDENSEGDITEREILYKVLFDMKNDLNDLKRVTKKLMANENIKNHDENVINQILEKQTLSISEKEEENYLSIQEHEKILIKKSLKRHQGRRKDAAEELGISERTLYRKIKEYLL